MMLLLYTFIYGFALLCLFPFEYLKRTPALRSRWIRERFGFVPQRNGEGPALWIHAVSVGEVTAAATLVRKIKEAVPALPITVSTVTDTGQKVAAERLSSVATIVYIPFDLPGALGRALDRVRPSAFVIMETELWPGLLAVLQRRAIPVLLINGRISDKSFSGYLRLRWFFRFLLRSVDLFAMQDNEYARRIAALGAAPETVKVMGNLKFDTMPASAVPGWTDILSRPVIVAGSTHPTEEDLVLGAYQALRGDIPSLSLIIAPRHPERFGQVEELVNGRGLKLLKRSELASEEQRKQSGPSARPDGPTEGCVVLLDVMGELAAVYGAADIAIIGGSFITRGGQNPLEPAFWGKPILCGPHMENFPFMDAFYREGAAIEVSRTTLVDTIRRLLSSASERAALGDGARRLYTENAGAAERAWAHIRPYLH